MDEISVDETGKFKIPTGLAISAIVPLEQLAHLPLNNTNGDKAKRYARRLKAGSAWPPLIGYSAEDGTLNLADGNHRLRAARRLGLGFVTVEVYGSEPEARAAVKRFHETPGE